MNTKSLKETTIGVGVLVVLVLFLGSTIWLLGSMSGSNIKPGIWWNEYTAMMDGFVVRIDESQSVGDKDPRRIVHLETLTNSMSGITGHDYGLDGTWERVFFNGPPGIGCNSYVRVKDGWRWEPCPSDKDMTPIPETEIPRAIALLERAMTNRTLDNLTTLWTYHSTTDLHRSRE